MMIAGPRIYREMARDGALPPVFGRLNRREAPAISIVAQGAWASVLVLTGTFENIVSYTGFAVMLFSALAVASLIVLRRRHGVPAGFRVPAYPVIPVLFLAIAAVMTVSAFTYATRSSMVGTVLILSGIAVFRMTRRRIPSSAGQ
jgi:APA family basic amino acid/polyamine antiporter